MDIKSISKQKEIFLNYTNKYVGENERSKLTRYMDKQNHSVYVLNEALDVNRVFTKYNKSFIRLLALESLFHDIGRFEQLKVTNTFYDVEIGKYFYNIFDHGDLGSLLLTNHNLIYELVPDRRTYDEDIKKTIKAHSKINNSLQINMEYIKNFRDYELKDVFKKGKEKERKTLFNANLAIIQDVDRLDILRKIVNGIFLPDTSLEPIDNDLIELYKKDELPPIDYIKKNGKWTPNVGHLVRLSFISQTNLIPVLNKIKEENLIDEIYKIIGNETLLPIYEIAKEKLDERIKCTEDGVLVKRKIL